MLNVKKYLDKYGSHQDDMILPPPSHDVEVKMPKNPIIPNIEEIEPESLRDNFFIYEEDPEKDIKTIAPKRHKHKPKLEEDIETMDTLLANKVSPNSLLKMCEVYYSLVTSK
jgi:hypothetical protein